jgi:hypothetical protein
MKRALFVITALWLSLSMTPLAQTENAPSCNASLIKLVKIRGLSLDMKPEEWMKLFPGSESDERLKSWIASSVTYPDYGKVMVAFRHKGAQPMGQSLFPYLSPELHQGLNQIALTLFDEKSFQFIGGTNLLAVT